MLETDCLQPVIEKYERMLSVLKIISALTHVLNTSFALFVDSPCYVSM